MNIFKRSNVPLQYSKVLLGVRVPQFEKHWSKPSKVELQWCETKVSAPVEDRSLYEINLVLRKTGFICDLMGKYYTTHNPKRNNDVSNWLNSRNG